MAAARRLAALGNHLVTADDSHPAPSPAAVQQKLRVGVVGLGGRGTGTLGTMEGSARLGEKMTIVALADVDPERLEPHKSKGYTMFATASELIQVWHAAPAHSRPTPLLAGCLTLI